MLQYCVALHQKNQASGEPVLNAASVCHEVATMRLEERHHRVRRVHFTLREPLQPTNPRARMNIDPSVLSRWAVEPAHLPAARVCRKSSLRPGKSCANATSRATNGTYLFTKLEPICDHLSTALEPKLELAERWSSAACRHARHGRAAHVARRLSP